MSDNNNFTSRATQHTFETGLTSLQASGVCGRDCDHDCRGCGRAQSDLHVRDRVPQVAGSLGSPAAAGSPGPGNPAGSHPVAEGSGLGSPPGTRY